MIAEEIGKAAVHLFDIVFGGKQDDFLYFLWYAKFLEMVSSSKVIDPQKGSIFSQFESSSGKCSGKSSHMKTCNWILSSGVRKLDGILH